MGEIDDWYKQEEERLEEEFFEKIKKGDDRKRALRDYEKKSNQLRVNFKSRYDSLIAKEMNEAKNPKKKKVKKEKFKHLEIKHFDFEFSWWEKKKRAWSLKLFRLNRRRKLFVERRIPNSWVYFYHKSIKIIKRIFRDIIEALTRIKEGIVKFLGKASVGIFNFLKKIYNSIKTSINNLLEKFKKRKADDGKEEKKGSEESGEEGAPKAEEGGDSEE